MPISRMLKTAWGKLQATRKASREAAAHKAAARDVAQKQILMQQLAETLQGNRPRHRR